LGEVVQILFLAKKKVESIFGLLSLEFHSQFLEYVCLDQDGGIHLYNLVVCDLQEVQDLLNNPLKSTLLFKILIICLNN
jgi:hypothetical protein